MTRRNALLTTAIGSLIALGLTSTGTSSAADALPKMEKCYGVSKADKNDCQTSNTACAGTAKKDGQKDAWIYVPQGTCDKIVGGSPTAKK